MGRRRRSQKKVKTQKKAVVAKVFKCPFCSHEDAVECKMNQKRQIGTLNCRICGASFQTTINYLSEPVDVFCEWIDECNKGTAEEGAVGAAAEDDEAE